MNSYLYGSGDGLTSLHFINNVPKLIDKGFLTKDSWKSALYGMTTAPYFFSLIDEGRVNDILESMLDSTNKTGRSPENLLGINRSGFNVSNIPKYCPLCNNDRLTKNEELYWNRLHQIPDIKICTSHYCYLEEAVNPEYSEGNRKFPLIVPDEKSCPINVPRSCSSKEIIELAELMIRILKGEYSIQNNYNQRAKNLGFASGRFLDRDKIGNEYSKFYKNINVPYPTLNINVFLDNKVWNPTRHLLLDYFLNRFTPQGQPIKVEHYKFWDKSYFGNGPWNCLNASCKHFGKPSIKVGIFRYDSKSRRTIGSFSCSCGTTYLMSFLIVANKIEKTRIRILKGSRQSEVKPKNFNLKKRNEQRKQWLDLAQLDTKTQIQKRAFYRFSKWLENNDPKWYQSQSKKKKQREIKQHRLNEASEVKSQLAALRKAFVYYAMDKPNFRITKSELIRKAGISKDAIKGKVLKYLEENSESIEEFQIRRLYATEKKLVDRGERITKAKLLYTAHIWNSKTKRVVKVAEQIAAKHF